MRVGRWRRVNRREGAANQRVPRSLGLTAKTRGLGSIRQGLLFSSATLPRICKNDQEGAFSSCEHNQWLHQRIEIEGGEADQRSSVLKRAIHISKFSRCPRALNPP